MTPVQIDVGAKAGARRCFGWLHPGGGETGLVIVPGGRQTRVGPHRLFVRLAVDLAAEGVSVLRFDRRGLGDGEGEDAGFEQAGADIRAAVAALRTREPQLRTVAALGLCDGASALLLSDSGADRLILLNPWVVEEGQELSTGASRAHYLRRLRQVDSWKRLATGRLNPFPAMGNLFRRPSRVASRALSEDAPLAARVFHGLARAPAGSVTILSDRDRAADEFRAAAPRAYPLTTLAGDHAFSRPEDYAELLAEVRSNVAG
ncbi:hydrolase 1, exosortase A system-associated [Pacificimonas flava]|uniref:Hydrolase 1, exosortase A system-associated n=2 Tax=Pacificimonas TaxID=1960290 RepID=A0A219B8R8_9SPHN|nr:MULTISPECIES: hydrolase 1, exosortase A system-associated [Pacificimonas]MBZ6380010.1 hydrolase 1, exosortase A system-associated [Pacificimonas aurantium]OWV34526.1 hydrolase 1, exosortase A system-associated [Pacificimonas flava]